MLTPELKNILNEFFGRKPSNKRPAKVDGKKILVGAGFRPPSTQDLRYLMSNYPRWKKDVIDKMYKRTKKRVQLIPLAADFNPTYLYIYFKIIPSRSDAIEVLISHNTEKVYDIDYIDLKDLKIN